MVLFELFLILGLRNSCPLARKAQHQWHIDLQTQSRSLQYNFCSKTDFQLDVQLDLELYTLGFRGVSSLPFGRIVYYYNNTGAHPDKIPDEKIEGLNQSHLTAIAFEEKGKSGTWFEGQKECTNLIISPERFEQ